MMATFVYSGGQWLHLDTVQYFDGTEWQPVDTAAAWYGQRWIDINGGAYNMWHHDQVITGGDVNGASEILGVNHYRLRNTASEANNTFLRHEGGFERGPHKVDIFVRNIAQQSSDLIRIGGGNGTHHQVKPGANTLYPINTSPTNLDIGRLVPNGITDIEFDIISVTTAPELDKWDEQYLAFSGLSNKIEPRKYNMKTDGELYASVAIQDTEILPDSGPYRAVLEVTRIAEGTTSNVRFGPTVSVDLTLGTNVVDFAVRNDITGLLIDSPANTGVRDMDFIVHSCTLLSDSENAP